MTTLCTRSARRSACAILFAGALSSTLVGSAITKNTRVPSADAAKAAARRAFDALPMRFEPNLGRVAPSIDFLARGAGYAAYISPLDTTLLLRGPRASAVPVRMHLARAARASTGLGLDELPGRTNQLTGNNPERWKTGISGYARVEYRDIYPGVNVIYYGSQNQLEYDFIVGSGANYQDIALTFDGVDRLRIDAHGNLILTTAAGELVQRAPVIYQQQADGTRTSIAGGYVIRRRHEVGFTVGRHDRRLPLVIDPVLTYSTFLGGSSGENPFSIAIDSDNNIYVAGETSSLDFPIVNGLPPTEGGYYFTDAFVAKLNAAGNQLIYATYLGGSQPDTATDVVVDAGGNAYISGYTISPDFPTANALQPVLNGIGDAFVTKLDPAGIIVYSTYLGGSAQDLGWGIAVDASGRAFVTGTALSTDFPMVAPLQSTPGGSPAFRTTDRGSSWQTAENGMKAAAIRAFAIDPFNPSKVYALSYENGMFSSADFGDTWAPIGEGLPSTGGNAIAITRTNPPTLFAGFDTGIFRSTDEGTTWTEVLATTSFVTALAIDPASPNTIYATQVPGAYAMGVFRSTDGGDSWINTGLDDAPELLAMSGPLLYAAGWNGVYRTTYGSGWATVLYEATRALAVDATNPSVVYAGTYLGVQKSTSAGQSWNLVLPHGPVTALAVAPGDPNTIYAATESEGIFWSANAGTTWHQVDPHAYNVSTLTVDPYFPTRAYAGSSVAPDAFVSVLSADGSALEYSTYVGGSHWELGYDIALDASGSAYVMGTTYSHDFPTHNGVQMTFGGGQDVFVFKLAPNGAMVYGTYIGGTDYEEARTIGVDAAGRAHVAGHTSSLNFPVANAYQSSPGVLYDLFVTTLDPAGSGFVYSTFLGGNATDYDAAIAVAPSGEAVVTASTMSSNFPTRDALQPALSGWSDAVVARFDPTGQLVSSTFLGGTGGETGRRAVFDSAGSVVVTGLTTSADFPTMNAIQPAMAGPADLYVARIADVLPDTIAPASAITLSGTAGSAGWYRSSVNVTVSAADNAGGSGVASIDWNVNAGAFQPYASPFAITTNGITQLRARATDVAGNVEAPGASAQIMIDPTAPASAITLSGTAGSAGWYRSSVLVTVSAADNAGGSGVASIDSSLNAGPFQPYTSPFAITTNGITQLRARATDVAGNVEAPGASAQIMIDATAPAVNVSAPETRAYPHHATLPIGFSASDTVSGLAAGSPGATLDGTPVANGQVVALLTLPLGQHTVTASAADAAGNSTERSVSFTIVATIDSLIATVNCFAAQGQIDASSQKTLLSKLTDAKQAIDRGNLAFARNKLESVIDFVNAHGGRSVAAAAAAVLVTDTRYVLAAL